MGHLINKIFANSVCVEEEHTRDGKTVKIYVSKWVLIWKNDVYIGCHKTK